jgi:hypothetical protein
MVAKARKVARRHLVEMRTVPLYGDFKDLGYYYVYISMAPTGGKGANKFSVILDTGSGLTVVPCTGCIGCGSHMGDVYTGSGNALACGSECSKARGSCRGSKCSFSISYSEGSSLSGHYVKDNVCLGQWDTCGEDDRIPFPFGCATTMTNLFKTQLADGIMGVNGNSRTTIIDALREHHALKEDVYSICLGLDGGEFVVGGFNSKLSLDQSSPDPMWVKQVTSDPEFYKVNVDKVHVGGRYYSVGRQATLDSGTTYTFIPSTMHRNLRTFFDAYCGSGGGTDGKKCLGSRNENVDKDAVRCYTFPYGTNATEVMMTYPAIEFEFEGRKRVKMLPLQYFFQTGGGAQCIGLYADPDFILGMNFFQYQNIIFDKSKSTKRIGFVAARCSEKDPYCIAGKCYSNILETVEMLAVMVLLSVFLIVVILRILRLQKLLPKRCVACCEWFESSACCKRCCKKETAYAELGKETGSDSAGIEMEEGSEGYTDSAPDQDEEGEQGPDRADGGDQKGKKGGDTDQLKRLAVLPKKKIYRGDILKQGI